MKALSREDEELLAAIRQSPNRGSIIAKAMFMVSRKGRKPMHYSAYWMFHAVESECVRAEVEGRKLSLHEAAKAAREAMVQGDKLLKVRDSREEGLPGADMIRRTHREVRKKLVEFGELDGIRKDLRIRWGGTGE